MRNSTLDDPQGYIYIYIYMYICIYLYIYIYIYIYIKDDFLKNKEITTV